MIFSFGLALSPVYVGAVDTKAEICKKEPDSPLCKKQKSVPEFIKDLVNTLLFILGAVAVIVIILSGVFYVTSIGDSNLIAKAKNTLLYAVVGLVVAIMAYAIVNFVINRFT